MAENTPPESLVSLRIILAEELTAALDSVRARIVMDQPRRLFVEQEPAIIAVTHDEKILDRLDRILHLRDARLEAPMSTEGIHVEDA